MATGAVAPPPLAGARLGFVGARGVLHRRVFATPMKDEPVVSTNNREEETVTDSLNVAKKKSSLPGLSSSLSNKITVTPTPLHPAEPSDLRFNRLRPSVEESDCKYKRLFGCYVAREAIMDEEYWIAAWLRAEHRYEDQSGDRYVESFKRKFASQEFHALKKRCSNQVGEKYTCFVAVKNDDLTRTVVNSVVGTLDVCVRHPLHGEKYPEYARRQGIATNMLLLAIDAARFNGAESIYIHVHKDNLPARRLYDHIGFKMVDRNGARQPSDLCLLSFSLKH
ncbi:hypothetical protein BRADI_1g72830v3 [Brachypodium distachyon]|uniref:N-acetyltransferase domain-containing protein n=1 Tax=Brachypodium distachyon TaxID=15368 RepID=A0A2K2DUT6_BRADI|nr:hypothetical protein BRADI_1g72830v3 [Brachypodium distachyon]